jgi:aspartyl-tRNA(Asn)/glutamyl-tRNA(Gln) amidotransferase subunit C
MKPEDKAPITIEEVRRIAGLAHLALSPEETARMTRELGGILTYVRQLEAIDVAGIPPTAHVQIERLPLRADEIHSGLEHDQALAEAPRLAQDGFAVPAFVDEG